MINKIFRKLYIFIDKLSFTQLFLSFFLIIFIFGFFYFILSSIDNGIMTMNDEKINYWKGLYFSIVTISSLGYGDMHPIGYARILAVIEVLFGLALLGVMIAKLTSFRISYHVKRLYVSDSISQLNRHLGNIQTCELKLSEIIKLFTSELSDVPTDSTNNAKISDLKNRFSSIRTNFSIQLQFFSKVLNDLKSYFEIEVNNYNFFNEISSDSVRENGNAIKELLEILYIFMMGLGQEKRYSLLFGDTGKYFNTILIIVNNIHDIVIENCNETKSKLVFSNLIDVHNRIKQNIIIVSVPIFNTESPNQIFIDSKIKENI